MGYFIAYFYNVLPEARKVQGAFNPVISAAMAARPETLALNASIFAVFFHVGLLSFCVGMQLSLCATCIAHFGLLWASYVLCQCEVRPCVLHA